MLHLHGSHGGHGAEVGTVSRYQGCLLLHQLGWEEKRMGPGPIPLASLPPNLGLGTGRGVGHKAGGTLKQGSTQDSAYSLGVSTVGSKLEGDGAEHAQLGGHLLHSAETSLLLCVSKLHHQAR